MKVKIENGCIGCGLCEGTCLNVFRITDDGAAKVFVQSNLVDEAATQEVADSCPTNVIITKK